MPNDLMPPSFVMAPNKLGAMIAGLILAALLLVATSLLFMADRVNTTEAERVQDVVTLGTTNILDQLRTLASDHSYWDEALRNLVEEPDTTWAERNIGSYLAKQHGIDAAFVVAPSGGIARAFVDGQAREIGDTPFSPMAFAPLIGALRRPDQECPTAGTILVADGHAYVTVASRITGDPVEGKRRPASGTHVLVLQHRIDDAMIETLRRQAGAADVRVSWERREDPWETAAPLSAIRAPRLVPIALPALDMPTDVHVVAVPRTPGLDILIDASIPFLLTLLGLGGLGVRLVRAFRRMQDRWQELEYARQAADAANLAKSKFLAAASHDLRQPMQSLFLFSAALATRLPDEKAQEIMGSLDRGLDTLKALLDSLLDVSCLDAGAIQPTFTTTPLDPIIGDIALAFRPIAEAKGLILRVAPAPDVVVRSDPLLLGRMIRNLIENAIRYTERGEISIECRVSCGMAVIAVIDTGIGIDVEQLDHIFEEFHQVGNRAQDRRQGLGLGLAIVRRLSSLLDHRIGVRSETGSGSTFTIDVPLGTLAADSSCRTEDSQRYTPDRCGHHPGLWAEDRA